MIIPHRDDVKIQSVVVSLNYLAVFERVDGLQARPHPCRMPRLGRSPVPRGYLAGYWRARSEGGGLPFNA